jgi:hypothetical protein
MNTTEMNNEFTLEPNNSNSNDKKLRENSKDVLNHNHNINKRYYSIFNKGLNFILIN